MMSKRLFPVASCEFSAAWLHKAPSEIVLLLRKLAKAQKHGKYRNDIVRIVVLTPDGKPATPHQTFHIKSKP